jgi:hypothetical protein
MASIFYDIREHITCDDKIVLELLLLIFVLHCRNYYLRIVCILPHRSW